MCNINAYLDCHNIYTAFICSINNQMHWIEANLIFVSSTEREFNVCVVFSYETFVCSDLPFTTLSLRTSRSPLIHTTRTRHQYMCQLYWNYDRSEPSHTKHVHGAAMQQRIQYGIEIAGGNIELHFCDANEDSLLQMRIIWNEIIHILTVNIIFISI